MNDAEIFIVTGIIRKYKNQKFRFLLQALSMLIVLASATPIPPNSRYSVPPQLSRQQQLPYQYERPPQEYIPPQETYNPAPVHEYGPPSGAPEYGPPSAAPEYGAPEYGAPVYEAPQQQQLITKNVYVHVAPEESEEVIPLRTVEPKAPQKHYKIIFIKAPSPPKQQVPVIPEQPQDEHKTLVYVLVKKPEEQEQLVLPEVAPTTPSKPEVYFIKYKKATKKPNAEYGAPKEEYLPSAHY